MNPFVLYAIAAVLFVLGLAAVGGAIFGHQRNRRIILAVAGAVLWIATLLLYSRAAAPAPAAPQPQPVPNAGMPAVSSATPPALSGRIVFHSDRDGDLDIYVMDADGSNVQQLTDAPGRDFEPHWSPDGAAIVFSSDRDDPDNAQLYLMDADGASQRRLASALADDQVGARWSPDGQWILFHSNPLVDGLPRFDVYKIRPDGSGLANLSNAPGNNFMGDWSPDAQRIVFVSQRDGNRELYVMNADGSNQARLTQGPWQNSLPRWSPDGQQIVFESNRSGTAYSLFAVAAPAGQGAGAATEGPARALTDASLNSSTAGWVSDDWLLISSDRDSTNVINWEIYLLKADGSEIYRLTDNPALDRFPSWTP